MRTITIPRDLAERLLSIACCSHYVTLPAVQELREALSASAGPLTAEECDGISKRLRAMRTPKVSLRSNAERAAYCMDIVALQLEDIEADAANAPAWTGPQPVEDGQSEQ